MKEIKLKKLDVSCFEEDLDNGLKIVLLPFLNKKNYFISYGTYFGADITNFTVNKKEVKVPDGIAHFLEHKMFEQPDGKDPFTFFSESGTSANASTSYEYTHYICYGNKEFSKNLRFLLQFVNKPFYTDENVEKEKGIIAEELKMYEDIPDFQLEMRLRENVFHKSPRRIDIGGSVKEIKKITKEDLYLCYDNFYTPSNMFVLIVGNFDVDEALNIIKEELQTVKNKKLPNIKLPKEELSVLKEKDKIYGNVKVDKLGLAIKIDTTPLKMDDITLDLYLNMITTILFGTSSEFRQRVRNEKLLNNFYMEWETYRNYHIFYMMASTTDTNKLLEEIDFEFNDLVISEEAFERMKKVWIANEVKMIDNVDATVSNLFDDLIKYRKIIPNKIDLIRNLSLEEINKLVKKIDFTNRSVVEMVAKEE